MSRIKALWTILFLLTLLAKDASSSSESGEKITYVRQIGENSVGSPRLSTVRLTLEEAKS